MKKSTIVSLFTLSIFMTYAQSNKEQIEAAGTYYFIPMKKLAALVPLENYSYDGIVDYQELAEMDNIYPNTEFVFKTGFDPKKVHKYAYVEDLKAEYLDQINNFAYALINKEIDAKLIRTTKDQLNDNESYYYVTAGIRSKNVEGFLIGRLKDGSEIESLSFQFEVFVKLVEHRPDKEYDKVIYGGSDSSFIGGEIDKNSIESPKLATYQKLKERIPEKIKKSLENIQKHADKKLVKKLSK